MKFSEKLYNKLATLEFTIGYSGINDKDDCILSGKKKKFKCLKLSNYKEWYADPIIIERDGETYVFMELFDNSKEKGKIAVSILTKEGFSKPKIIIDEEWHMSFPFIFEYKGSLYMLPETRQYGSLILYKCVDFPYRWERLYELNGYDDVVDTVVIEKDSKLLALTPQKSKKNGLYTKLTIGELYIYNDNRFEIRRDNWDGYNKRAEYLLWSRNGGSPFIKNNHFYRVTQESTEIYYGIGLRIFELMFDDKGDMSQKQLLKITVDDFDTDLPASYRIDGIHTYGRTDKYEIIDVKVTRLRFFGKRIIHWLGKKRRA